MTLTIPRATPNTRLHLLDECAMCTVHVESIDDVARVEMEIGIMFGVIVVGTDMSNVGRNRSIQVGMS